MEKQKKKGIQRFLDFVERGGNKLPHPLTLFWIFCLIIAIISAMLYCQYDVNKCY